MQIIIPMSGFGERFRRAGYSVPKPLIEVDGKPIIAHVVDLFPGDHEFLFICNQDHLDAPEYRMREILQDLAPDGRILGIAPHKLGPVHAVRQAFDLIDDAAQCVVNYCDFTCYWDFDHFARFVAESRCDGAIPCYTGFHPHMLGSTSYAYVKTPPGSLWGEDIQEKQPYTDTPTEEFASSGTYYFRSGALLKQAFDRCVAEDLTIGGEFYVSLTYKPLFADGRNIAVYPLQHFMQWGTPQDLAEYQRWSAMFRDLLAPPQPVAQHDGAVMVPMAGLGSRFAEAGYATPKPLIAVNGKPMAVQATEDLPDAPQRVFIHRADMPGLAQVEQALRDAFGAVKHVRLAGPTDGQARTCMYGVSEVDWEQPLTIGACDNGALYDHAALQTLLDDPAIDIIVWGMRGHPGARLNPQMYGWIGADEAGNVSRVAVKQPLEDPASDPIIVGTFTFKKAQRFVDAAEHMFALFRDKRVNGEYYVDMLINDAVEMGLRVKLFEVDHYLCWGTPGDLQSFEYWQGCFHKWPGHPYQLERDGRIAPSAVQELAQRFAATAPQIPAPRG
ncbi:NTP transferase domain-containing protein [Magnetofaba australis]|uniref:Nucleotidyl transferase domain-containing protein n=1 Tax=Magnetofaba australis IT-1 TaxID=1434232 RepID=A0A1Y2K2P8_9PROT|nr:NTP transferase domain-containing protein [Magnetofaba australis]OSM02283.1 hypothetical protein MAIT1_02403 [Magnetofaba australis IT-1]